MKFVLSSLSGRMKEKELWIYRVDQLLKLAVEFDSIIITPPKTDPVLSRSKKYPTIMINDCYKLPPEVWVKEVRP